MGAAVPKQFIEVAGKPVLRWTLEAFEAEASVDEVVVVVGEGQEGRVRELAAEAGLGKVAAVVRGGATRSDSSTAAVGWAWGRTGGDRDCKLLIHDGARMLVPAKVIAAVAAALEGHGAAAAAVPSADTVVAVRDGDGGTVLERALERDRLRRVQTPQGFRLGLIRDAYAAAAADPGFTATDDCSVVLRYLPDVPVLLVPGDERNLKVTGPADLAVAAALLDLP
ncbi:2-C-methyl-D-erythritol 4-phosphate cytidylyltransferase [Glycomyces paridis]|uniref:2-C-methyl-D-erythritol 4-phosphate cytidylyltransferase n=2 Tax=Glycomyces paridis TaxID=2126555 RepID=A0A4S8PVS6_9ACTN|nr:2-C-methyl-D-erythritol 4-phosphate cytidylyltransferase [Glycomyces paridis]